MSSKSKFSFINGVIAGAGVVLAIMSFGLLQLITGMENIPGVTTMELRVAIVLGAIVTVVAIGYEFYYKEKPVKEQIEETEKNKTGELNAEESPNEPSSHE